MEEFDFEISHRAGRCHGNADAMSRRPCRQKECLCTADNGAQSCEACVDGVEVHAVTQVLQDPGVVPAVSCSTSGRHSQPADIETLECPAAVGGERHWRSTRQPDSSEEVKVRVRLRGDTGGGRVTRQQNDHRVAAVSDVNARYGASSGGEVDVQDGVGGVRTRRQQNDQRVAAVNGSDADGRRSRKEEGEAADVRRSSDDPRTTRQQNDH